jgi:pimeloyl-ACP methyl ester carboxylesterase
LPGYGFSDKPSHPGWTAEHIAAAWAELMARLEYNRYGPQGADWGAMVTANLGQQDPEHVAGIHLNMPMAAQCTWIVEKFWAWTDCDGHPENALTRDELLDNVTLYWLPAAGASSARLYWESFRGNRDRVYAPTGISIFPKEIARTSRRWAEKRFTDIRYWSEVDKGGHFAALEQPELFVDEIRAFFRLVR